MDAASLIIPASPAPGPAPARNPAAGATETGFAAVLDQAMPPEAPKAKGAPEAETEADQETPAAETPRSPTESAAPPVAEASEGDGEGATDDEMAAAPEEPADMKVADQPPTDPAISMAALMAGLAAPARAPKGAETAPEANSESADITDTESADVLAAAGEAAARNATKAAATPPEAAAGDMADSGDGPALPDADGGDQTASLDAPRADGLASMPQAATARLTDAPVGAPAPMAAPPPVPLEPEALGLAIARHAADGMDVFEISLTPDELGRVDVRLEIGDDGRVAAHVYADRPETLAMLQRDRGELARALAGQGMNADAASLTFSLRGDDAGARNFAGGDNGAGNRDGGRRGQGRGRGAADFAATEAAAARPAFTRSRAIDIAV